MTVSIVIPCFNHARYLPAAIESAQSQSWSDCEVFVVDDGSTDGSGDVAARFAGIQVIRQANRGLSAARNAGLDASRGDLIIFLDADDALWPDAARIAVTVADAHPDAGLIFGRCRLVDERGRPLPTNLGLVRSRFYEELLRANYIWMPGMAAVRRRVFDVVGRFNPHVSPAADYDLYLRIARRFGVVAHEAIVADYRQHGANMSANPIRMLQATLAVLNAQHRDIRHDRQLLAAYRAGVIHWRQFYGERLVDRFRSRLHQGRYLSATADAIQLLRYYPSGVRRHLAKKIALSLRGSRFFGGGNGLTEPKGF